MSVDSKQIPITSPCPINLDRSGVGEQDRSLHCAHCVKDVHLLSNMTELEARAFMQAQAGEDICVSYAIKRDGGIRFRAEAPASCAPEASATFVPRQALMRRVAPRATARSARASAPASMLASLGVALLLAACAPHSDAGAIRVDEETPAPLVDEVVIPSETPCDPQLKEVVEGGIKALPLPKEQHIAGGLRAEPVPELLPDPVPEAPEVHTPPPQDALKADTPKKDERVVRGRIALDRSDDPLG